MLATLLGTVGALGIFLGSFRGKAVLVAALSLPMVVPVVVTAIAVYFAFSLVGLNNTLAGLILAHTVLSVPYVLITVLATLQTFDRNLLKAAATLGAPPHVAFRRVVLPLIAPGVATGALFAFATSFDELVVAIFVASPGQFTLPRQMYAGVREFLSPTIAAAAVLLILVSLVLLVLNELFRSRSEGAHPSRPPIPRSPIDAVPNDPIVTFDEVSKSYDGKSLVVNALDLALLRGEFLTLLGPSGSGKTTTLMMLAGFEDPTSGTITLEGRRLNNVPAHRRGIGMVFQNYALFPHMSVAENLTFPLEMHGCPKGDMAPKVQRALDMVRLPHLRDRKPAQLSGGQQQRVAVARALVFEPKLVLMDEPLGALDKQLREQMQLEIKHLHENLGVTVVYVTHDQSEALTMSDRIAVFHHGRVQQLARPAELYERPANAFVASFIGENNRLGRPAHEPRRRTVPRPPGRRHRDRRDEFE